MRRLACTTDKFLRKLSETVWEKPIFMLVVHTRAWTSLLSVVRTDSRGQTRTCVGHWRVGEEWITDVTLHRIHGVNVTWGVYIFVQCNKVLWIRSHIFFFNKFIFSWEGKGGSKIYFEWFMLFQHSTNNFDNWILWDMNRFPNGSYTNIKSYKFYLSPIFKTSVKSCYFKWFCLNDNSLKSNFLHIFLQVSFNVVFVFLWLKVFFFITLF